MRLILHHFDDLRNHIASALHRHKIADTNAQPGNLIRIVQRRPRHRGTSNQHGSQRGHRGQLPCPSHLKQHILQLRNPRPRRKFVRNRPSRSLPRKAQPPLLRREVHLDYNAIDLVAQRVSQRLCIGNKPDHRINVLHRLRVLIHTKPRSLQRIQGLRLERQKRVSVAQQKVPIKIQPPLRHNIRLERPYRSRCSIPWICRWRQPLRHTFLIHLLERSLRQYHLTPHFKTLRQTRRLQLRRRNTQRHRADRPPVARHILANRSISPSQPPLQMRSSILSPMGTRPIVQRQRQPIELQLTYVAHGLGARQPRAHPLLPRTQLLLAVRVIERQHRPGVRRLHKSFLRLAPNPLRRRVRRHQFRMFGLHLLQLVHQRVVLCIRQLRSVFDEIEMLIMPKRIPQLLQLLFDRKFPRHTRNYREVFTPIISGQPSCIWLPHQILHLNTNALPPPSVSGPIPHPGRAKASRAPERPGHLRAGSQQCPTGTRALQRFTRHLRPRRRHLYGTLRTRQRHRHRSAYSRRHAAHQHNPLHRKDVLPSRLHRRYSRPLAALHREHPLPGCPRPRRKEALLEDPPPLGHCPSRQRPRSLRLRRHCRSHRRTPSGHGAVPCQTWQ